MASHFSINQSGFIVDEGVLNICELNNPMQTKSQPVIGKEAKRLLASIDSGGYVTNPAAEETVQRIVNKRKEEN